MTANQILDFLKTNKEAALATAENNRPKIRVFQIMKVEDTNLYFATGEHKEVYNKLLRNTFVELFVMQGEISIRIEEAVRFDVD